MDEQNPKQSGLNVEVPETDLKLSSGSITSDVKLNSGTDNNVDVEQEAFDMDKLSVSNPVKYLVTYNSPREWILDQREAEMAQTIRDTAMPEQASKVGSIAYAAGEFKRKTGNMARDFSEYAAGVDAYLLPNANKDIAERAYKNMKKLSVQTENNRADYISEHGVDPDVYGVATNVMEVARDMVLTAGVAGAARRSATKAAFGYASSRLAPSAADVAERFAVQQGKKVASGVAKTAIAGETFMREAGDRATQQAAQYMDATGDYDLKYYDPTVDLALNTGVSAINSAIEMSLGIERIVPDMIFGTRSVGRFAEEFIKGYISERSEEFLQNIFDQGGDLLSGYRDNISLAQAWSDSASAGWIGGIFGSGTAAGMYYLNRRRMIRQLQEDGIEKDVAAKFVDKVLQDGINKTLSNMSSTVELRTKEGPAYEKMKAGIKNALLMQGWNEKMVDPQTGEVRNIDSYVETFINNDAINKAISEALSSGLSIDDWLDIAQFAAIDNVLYVRPMGSVEDIQKRIDEQDAVIKRQTELKKTGADKPGVLQEARTAKAILQKLKANKLLDGEIERVSIEEAKTPEIVKEIDTATTDAVELDKANTAAEFVGNIEGTDEQKTKRLGNAVMKRIFKDDKRGFDAVMTKPEYANVRAAINSSAAKIFDYIKAHRAYGVAKDLYDALKLLPTVKSGNFISTVNTPDLTGQDPVARNAFLYNFVFNDAHATSAFIDAYLIRAEESINGQTKVRLGKKDLVGQAFKAMDALMQTQADVAGLQYTSIYNEDGSVADPNVAAVVASWQNLFVEVPEQRRLPQQFLEQFDLANENARLDEIYPPYDGDTIEVDGRIRTVYNSEGKRINKSAEALTNFWRWFGDSKVVDEQGRPLVVYHSTKADFDTFKILYHKTDEGLSGEGFYFTPSKEYSKRYGDKTLSLYLSVQNMLEIQPTTDEEYTEIKKGNFKPSDKNKDLAETLVAKYRDTLNDAQKQLLDWDMQDNMYDSAISRVLFANKDAKQILKEQGYDGVKYVGKKYDLTEYTVYNNTQIKSVENLGYYNAQDPRMLYQPVYVSLKGDLEGEYIDADTHLGRGDDTRVWKFGNYSLLSQDIDKEHYFDRFEREGPAIRYNGKELKDLYKETGIKSPTVQSVIENHVRDIKSTKEQTLDRLDSIIKEQEDFYKQRIEGTIRRFAKKLGGRKAVRDMIKDINDIITSQDEEYQILVASRFPKDSKLYEIQKKYRNEDDSLSDDFIDLYTSMVEDFEPFDGLYAQDNAYIGRVLEIYNMKKSTEAFKKLDWDKFTGRLGFLYKGEHFQNVFWPFVRDTRYYEYARSDIVMRTEKVLKKALKTGQDVQEALNGLDSRNEYELNLIPKINEEISKRVDEYKDRYPNADAEAVKKILNKYMTTPQMEIKGFAPSVIWEDEWSYFDSPTKDLLNAVQGSYVDLSMDKENPQESTRIGALVDDARMATTRQAVLNAVKGFFKGATNADFVYKSRATMIEGEAPEDNELLNASRDLDRQPKEIRKALIEAIRYYMKKYPDLHLGDWITTRIRQDDFETNPEIVGRIFGVDPEVMHAFIIDQTEKNFPDIRYPDVDRLIVKVMWQSFENAMLKNENPTIADLKKEVLNQENKYFEHGTYDYYPKDRFIATETTRYLTDALNKKKQKESLIPYAKEFPAFDGVKLLHVNAFKFLDSVERLIWLNRTEYNFEEDKTLGLRKIPVTDEILVKMLRKFGIKGLKYYGQRDKRGIVTWQKLPVNRILYSLDFTRPKLVVTHGISSYNLDKALELGGLPAPSLAIVKASDPRTEFGDIKLVGTADMIDPANPQNRVYDRDIWSQRVPQPEYKKVPSAKIRPLREKFDAVFARVGETQKLNEVVHTLTNTARPEDAISYFWNSDAAQLYYIENVLGKKIDIPTYDVAEKIRPNLTLFVTPDDQFIEEISKIDLNIDNSLVLKAKIMPVVMGLIERNDFEKKYGQHAEKFKQKAIEYYTSDNFNTSKMFELVEETKRYLREKGKREIDKLALFDKLKEYRLWDDPRYMMWARDQFNGILGEPRVRVGGKLVEWNAENLVKAMTRGPTVGSEKAFPGVGQAIAAGATRFSNLEEIRQAGRRLKTIDEANSITDKAGNAVTSFAEGLIDKFGEDYREDIYKATAKIAGLGTPAASSIENIISRAVGKSANLTNEEIAGAKKMAQLIKDVTRSYFEAKPQRVVSFDEFAGAIVPTNPAYDESAQKLADRGLTVVRSDDVAEGMEELSSLREEVLFQGRRAAINGMYDPELGTILIGKNFNGTTLPHEMAHYWLDTIFKVFKQAQAGKLNVRPEWMAQKREMFAMLGINENQTSLTRGQQEKFATMLEAYVSGVGVTNEITRTFTDYLKWVPEKYRNLQQLSYVDENGVTHNVFLDAKAVEFFNRWYENPSLPSLSTSPERQRFMNVRTDDGSVIRVSIKEVNDREKEFAQDAEEQLHTDQRLYNTLDENMPAEIKAVSDAQKVVISERGNFLKATEEEQKKIITPDDDRKRRWFERKSRETEAQLAQEYIEKNPEHAHEVIFGDPELIPNDTGIDRATLINTYMATNGITEDKPEWAQLHTNIAINQSMAGTQLALSNDKSYRTYLDALREIEEALELKAATNYAGASVGARERFNSDIQQFLSKELPAVFATEAGSKEREIALKQMFEKARTMFSGNTTGRFLTQMDMEYAKAQKRNTDAFVKWAEKVIKTEAGAKLNAEQQAHLLKISAKAQQALTDIDSKDAGVAVAGALELRKWQLEKQKLMGVAPKKFSLFGDYAPRAMLASPNTLLFANIPSTAINTLITNLAKRGDLFGENNVSEKLIKNEIKRIKAIYGSTAMNLAQMEKPTSPTLLHGEKYSASGQKWYDPYTILGREDNLFRVPTFVNTLARIASKDAKATGRSADEVFLEYIKLNDQSDSAKLARKQALAVANMAVFTQNGPLARCLNHIRSELNYLSRAPLGLDPHGFGLGSLIAPFLSTGANIAEMGIRGTIAPIVTLTTYAQALRTGKAIDPLKKLALRMDWTYFVLSAVSMALLAALTSDDDEFYIDPYKTGMGYDPNRPYDSINIGGVWVDIDFFGPFAIPMRTAAKVIQAWKKDNGVGTSLGMGYAESAKSVLGDIPLAESIINNQFEWAMKKPGAFAGSYVYNQGNKLVPAGIKPILRALSRGQGWMLQPFEGTTVGRKFNRNYGFDGQELTSQDLLEMFTIKFQLGPDAQQYLDNILGLQ